MYKFHKDLYGLKQEPMAWYDTLFQFLIYHEFIIGSVDKTLLKFTKNYHILLVQIYVEDIFFDLLTQSYARNMPG